MYVPVFSNSANPDLTKLTKLAHRLSRSEIERLQRLVLMMDTSVGDL